MVDRYESLIQDVTGSRSKKKNMGSSILLENNNRGLNELIKKSESSAATMKKCIQQYRDATTSQQEQEILARFKQEEGKLNDSRNLLTREYKEMGDGKGPEKMLIKEQLLRTVQRELRLDVEMNELMEKKANQLQLQMKRFQPGSQKLKNALSDLTQKRTQIIYLQEQVQQCVQLLQLIGILVLENSQKIESALEQVQIANQEIDKSLKVIQIAKINTQRSRKRKCCIIVLGLVVVVVLVAVLFGIGIVKL